MSDVKFQPGDQVVVAERLPRHHHRVPTYVKGRRGVVERLCGVFGNPETLAHQGDGKPEQPLYRVRFTMDHLWAARAETADDTIEVELYQHWLEAAQ
jgi:hypothetical protein